MGDCEHEKWGFCHELINCCLLCGETEEGTEIDRLRASLREVLDGVQNHVEEVSGTGFKEICERAEALLNANKPAGTARRATPSGSDP